MEHVTSANRSLTYITFYAFVNGCGCTPPPPPPPRQWELTFLLLSSFRCVGNWGPFSVIVSCCCCCCCCCCFVLFCLLVSSNVIVPPPPPRARQKKNPGPAHIHDRRLMCGRTHSARGRSDYREEFNKLSSFSSWHGPNSVTGYSIVIIIGLQFVHCS